MVEDRADLADERERARARGRDNNRRYLDD